MMMTWCSQVADAAGSIIVTSDKTIIESGEAVVPADWQFKG